MDDLLRGLRRLGEGGDPQVFLARQVVGGLLAQVLFQTGQPLQQVLAFGLGLRARQPLFHFGHCGHGHRSTMARWPPGAAKTTERALISTRRRLPTVPSSITRLPSASTT